MNQCALKALDMISYAHVCVRGLRVNITFAHIQTGLRLMRGLSAILGHFSRKNLILRINHSINRKSSHPQSQF